MRLIKAEKIKETVAKLCLQANFVLRSDVLAALKGAYKKESSPVAKKGLAAIIENSAIAKEQKMAICQDTGLPTVFVELGQGVIIEGDFARAVMSGVEAGYRRGRLRKSVVRDPLERKSPAYSPAIVHVDIVRGNKIKISVLPKGFGCENKTQLKMLKPTATLDEIKSFIVDSVKMAGPDACPPYVVGVGIGGTADHACLLAKKALLKKINTAQVEFERVLLKEIDKLNIGPMGLGGKTTCLAVKVIKAPTHIAGLPVCVCISCHALRSADIII